MVLLSWSKRSSKKVRLKILLWPNRKKTVLEVDLSLPAPPSFSRKHPKARKKNWKKTR